MDRARRRPLISSGVGGAFGAKFEDAQRNETSSFLPADTESMKALEAVQRDPDGELAPRWSSTGGPVG